MTSSTRPLLVGDTSFISAVAPATRRTYDPSAWSATLSEQLRDATVAISVVTIAELRFGHARARWGARRRREAERFLNTLVQFPVD